MPRLWLGAFLALAALILPAQAEETPTWRPGTKLRPLAAAPATPVATVRPMAARQNPAIVRIWARQAGSSSGGSGTLVGLDDEGTRLGLIITNRHVVADGGRIEIHWPTGEQSVGKVEAIGGGADDLAAIFVRVPDGIEPVPMRDDEPEPDETLWIAGYGGSDQPFDFGPGRYVPMDDVNADIRGTPARHGDSGGPIIDADGKLSGVLWGSTGDDGGRETVCIRLPRVRNFLRKVAELVRYNCAACGGGSSHRSSAGPRGDAPDILDGGEDDDFAGGPVPADPYTDDEDDLTPVKPPTTKPKDDGKIAALEKQLEELTKKIDELTKQSIAGPPGPAGPMGPAGPSGAAADSERLVALEERITRHESAIAEAIELASRRQEIPSEELERIAAAVQKKLAGSIRLKVESVPKGGTAHAMLNPKQRTEDYGR